MEGNRGVIPAVAGGLGRFPLGGCAGAVVDLFCGAGALSHGFLQEGFLIERGYDIDESCRFPFEENNHAPFVRQDVRALDPKTIIGDFTPASPKILIGCAPCQPFSMYSQGRNDPKWQLLPDFSRLIVEVEPDVVTMENVPRLVKFQDGKVFDAFVKALKNAGYFVRFTIARCPDFGVPQDRKRLVLIGSRHGEPMLPQPTHTPDRHATVSDAIGDMPPLAAGETDATDRLHRSSRMSELNLERIRMSHPGRSWHDWPPGLVTECHRRPTGKGYSSVYGRMKWDRPSPTITTQFYGFGNGRFGHPEQDRALSLREGAILQTFPRDYAFAPPGGPIQFKNVGRMIGNAVPVGLARAIARAIKDHLEDKIP